MLSDWIGTRFKDKFAEDHDLVVMGDFNTPKIDDKLFKSLTSCGLLIPDALVNLKAGDQVVRGSNLKEDARYDQILHMPTMKKRFSNSAGTLDFFGSDAQIKELFPDKAYTREKFSFQLSDHFPVWAQIKTDIDGERLNQIVQDNKKA
jgi:endonuclease/exonuclease/phosphatase family metal-dependent hydrolase